MSKEKNLLVGQSGGPTVVINSSLAGVISSGIKNKEIEKVYGSLHGIQGVLKEEFVDLGEEFADNQPKIDRLKNTPSMYLGSCRYKLSSYDQDDTEYKEIFRIFAKYHIGYFFYIGGNDSMDTVDKLSSYGKKIGYDISIIGIPKTIDNDLVGMDHTPGFGSAAKYIASSVLEIAHDTYIYDTNSVTIVEIMGRNAGWLTAASALARNEYNLAPHLIYLPEKAFQVGQFMSDIRKQLEKRKHVIVAVSEGVKDQHGSYISAQSSEIDQFGHIMLSGTGKYLEVMVQSSVGCKVRSVELNVLQRSAAHLISLTDQQEAFLLGERAVEVALQGITGVMVALNRTSDQPYEVQFHTVPVQEVANLEKKVPLDWITPDGNDITEEMITYLNPLILGEGQIEYAKGIPCYLGKK